MKLPYVIIGIPAFNEEANICLLLTDLLAQRRTGFRLTKIIVISDNSTDNTVRIASKINNSLVRVISANHRLGKAARVNQLFRMAKKNNLVILDADIRLPDPDFISKLITPVVFGQADLTSAAQLESPPVGFIESVFYVSKTILNQAYTYWRDGHNFFTCHGQARAFSNRLCQALVLPGSVGEDLYSYLYCITKGFNYQFVPSAKVLYRLPTNLADHSRQTKRLVHSIKRLKTVFGKEVVEREVSVPWKQIIISTLAYFIRNPLQVSLYVPIFIATRLISPYQTPESDAWSVAVTSRSGIRV